MSTRAVFLIILLSLLATCSATMLETFLEFVFGVKMKQRSMSEIITGFLDELFPHDDMDTKAMKDIFNMYNEEGNNLFSNQYEGVDYLAKKFK